MAEIVVLGAGLGGTLMTYELVPQLRPEDRLTLIGQEDLYHFVPSNPWVAVGWRERPGIEADLHRVMARKGVRYLTQGARRVDPTNRRIEMNDGESVSYDYLVLATGPELAFDEIAGLGPDRYTQSIGHVDHAVRARAAFEEFCKNPGAIVVGAVQSASCFGPAYEFACILDTELRKRRIRDRVKMTFVTPEPYIGHLGLDGVGDTKSLMEHEFRNRHIAWITNARVKAITADQVSVEEVDEAGAVRATRDLRPRSTSASCCAAAGPPHRAAGVLCALPISATAASPLWPSRRSHRATSTGRRKGNGCTWQRSRSKNIFCTKCAPASASRFTKPSCCAGSTCTSSRRWVEGAHGR